MKNDFNKALEWLRKGYKVRNKLWGENNYLYIEKETGDILPSFSKYPALNIAWLNGNEWEIYKIEKSLASQDKSNGDGK